MNLAHLHLATVHLPVVAIPLLALLLFVGIRFKKSDILKAALLGFIGVTLLSIPIFLTGEAAEEAVEHVSNISEDQIETHEDIATFAFALVVLSGILSLSSLFLLRIRPNWSQYSLMATFLIAFACSGTLFWAANEGGRIHHSEVFNSKATTGDHQLHKMKEDDD